MDLGKTMAREPEEIEETMELADTEYALKDVGFQIMQDAPGETISEQKEKSVKRKIDFVIMPLLLITYTFQYMDKVLLNGASQFGIVHDLDLYTLKGIDPTTHEAILDLTRFSNATLIFYWGCLAGLLPASFLAQKLPIGKFLAGAVIVWGAIVMITVTVGGYHGFLVQRFFLGFVECAVAPGFSIIIAMWWKRREQPLRLSIWYFSIGFGVLFGSLLLFGIGHIQGALSPWKYQYLILGALTVVWGLILLVLLPDNPVNAWFLQPGERTLAVLRMRAEQTGVENKTFKLYQVKEALVDPKTWLMLVTNFGLQFANGAVSGFGAIIIHSFGYSHLKAILINGAMGGCILVTLTITGVGGSRILNARAILLATCEIAVILGSVLVWKVDWETSRGAAIAGFLLLGSLSGAYMMLLALSSANTAGHTKKVFTTGLLWCSWALSNGLAPLTVKTTEAALHYPTCFGAAIATAAMSVTGSLVLRGYLQWRNRRRDQKHGRVNQTEAFRVGFDDQTDMENKFFRYAL